MEKQEPTKARQQYIVQLTDTEIAKLQRLAKELGVTTSQLVRHWIAQ